MRILVRQLTTCLALLFLVCVSQKASADLILSFGTPTSLVEGSSGKIDVFLRRGPIATPNLSGFAIRLAITPTGSSPSTGLVFSNPQLQGQLTNSTYVFPGSSGGFNNTFQTFNTIYNASDFSTVPAGVSIPTTNRLLLSLDLAAVTQGNYSLSIVGIGTSFTDSGFNTINYQSPAPLALTVSAVPEPSSMLLLGASACGAWYMNCRRRRKRRSQQLLPKVTEWVQS